jgi:hypothetical protein
MVKAVKKNEYFHSDSQKGRGVAAYAGTGSFQRASQITGIPETTLRYWSKQDWWGEAVLRVDKEDSEELKTTFTRIAKKSITLLEDRLDNGDEIVTKDGSIVKRQIPGKELAIIAAVSADKRRAEINAPSSVANESSTEKLARLAQDFIKFIKAKEIVVDAQDSGETSHTIEGEGVQRVIELRDSDLEDAKGGESQEGDHPTNPQGSQA